MKAGVSERKPARCPVGAYGKDPAGRNRGFSLLEIFVVLVLLGIVSALAAPATGRFLDSLTMRKQVHTIMSTLRYARLMAITKGRDVKVRLATEGGNHFIIEGAAQKVVALEMTDEDSLESRPDEIIFSPEGYVTPAFLVFSKGDREQRIFLDPLSALPVLQ